MRKIILVVLLFGIILNTGSSLYGQTCCSGGVPISNNIGGLPPANKGTFQISLNYDANYLRTLKDEEITLYDDSRNRTTYSLLLKTAYTITNQITLETLFSGVRQQRRIVQGGFEDFTQTTGLGDAVFMVYYKYLSKTSLEMSAGVGPKIPLGASDLKNDNGITLNADLQPGSGAWDGIFHHRISNKLSSRPSLVLTNLITYRLTGVNPHYLGSQKYQFGDELSIVIGASDQMTLFNKVFGYGLNLRYRHAGSDKNNDQLLPNTGGQWLFIIPTISWIITPGTAISFSSELPLYSHVTGTQLTPTFRINLGAYASIRSKKDNIFNIK